MKVISKNCKAVREALAHEGWRFSLVSNLRELKEHHHTCRGLILPSDEPCPDTSVIVALEGDELDEETAQHVRAHLLFCKLCREEYLLLRRLSNEQFEEKVVSGPRISPRLTEVDFLPTQGGIECRGISGSGHISKRLEVATLGDAQAPSRSICIEDTVEDAGSDATSTIIRILVEVDPERTRAMMHVEANPPRKDWTASLVGPDGTDLARIPLISEMTILGSELSYGSYAVNIVKGDTALAGFAIEIRSP